ncbi:hypothetical protein A3759_12620 [Thalassolituus sp. HI0120]|nr:hypothetical protein A3759_12620 [Thalassolituus sp. HI0120]
MVELLILDQFTVGRFRRSMSIKSRILLSVIALQLIGFVALVYQFSHQAGQSVFANNQQQIISSVTSTLHHFNALAAEMSRSARGLARAGELIYQQRNRLTEEQRNKKFSDLLINTFTPFPQAIGGGIWYEPYQFDNNIRLLGPYAYRSQRQVMFSWELNSDEYNYPKQDWYQLALPDQASQNHNLGQDIFWTPPYFDEAATEALMTTVDALMFDQQQAIGMATVDWSMEDIRRYLSELKLTPNSQTFLIYPGSPDSLLVDNKQESIQINQKLRQWQDKLGSLKRSEISHFSSGDSEKEQVVAGLTNTGLVFGVIVPDSDLAKIVDEQTQHTLTTGIGIAVMFVAIVALLLELLFRPFDQILFLLKSSISVNPETHKMQMNTLNYQTQNEFKPLVGAFNTLVKQIERYTEQLSETNDELLDSQSEIAQLNASLEEKVQLRTEELNAKKEEAINSLQQLKLTQKQLVNMEKYAALGELIAGLAHEVNTPLGIAVTAVTALEDQLHQINSSFRNKTLDKQKFSDFVDFANEGSQITIDNLRRAADLISRFKQVAVDQASEQYRDFELGDYVNSVVTSLRPNFKTSSVTITVNCSERIHIASFPGALSQVLTNLIMNSLIHAYDEKQSGEIIIDVGKLKDQAIIGYRDDGKGMTSDVLQHMFEPFFTTRRSDGGSGLGAHIIYDLVTERLGGQLMVCSSPGQGSEFRIQIPLRLASA